MMKKRTLLLLCLVLLGTATRICAQNKGPFSDLPAAAFENLIFSRTIIVPETDSLLYLEIVSRLKAEKYVSDEAIIDFMSKNMYHHPSQCINAIDTLLLYCNYRPYLQLSLLGLKATVFRLNSFANDSVKLSTFSRIEAMEEITLHLTKIKYQNYVDLGDHFYKLREMEKAEAYFLKGKGAQYYSYNQQEEIQYFYQVYLSASLGLIRSIGLNYSKLKDLNFIPSSLLDICPTLSSAMIKSGGQCKLCESILLNSRFNQRFPVPPIVIPNEDEH